ncbi:pantoate--beta-alanine ligase [Propylenella binzhouense]|uniref:Pantothenate synthetase n=1 Tax=Propylenella binzhouense TaxID=2555902 RepID=A0A964WSC0_9HYPH|nr:pantoate--beta-alanine ligase [Propylenella binzhouense]MYZ46655.1 pantoate--beta-alanine ligase [Propylenella binzhouense]
MNLNVVRTRGELRQRVDAWRRAGASTIAMVPTMGALHAGHVALVESARRACDRVVVTLFVNPTQFAPNEDFAAYPRTEDADRAKLEALGVDVLFAPSTEEMYPPGFATTISVAGPSEGLESAFRPHFFAGVATVVAKLLVAGMPDQAYFGEKDYQQLLVVRCMAADLGLPTEIIGRPTVREADGLALSSRNAYLSPDERARAPLLHRSMSEAAQRIAAGGPPTDALAEAVAAIRSAGFDPDYLEVRNAASLAPVDDWRTEPLRMLAAARLGRTRLIDNIPVANPA